MEQSPKSEFQPNPLLTFFHKPTFGSKPESSTTSPIPSRPMISTSPELRSRRPTNAEKDGFTFYKDASFTSTANLLADGDTSQVIKENPNQLEFSNNRDLGSETGRESIINSSPSQERLGDHSHRIEQVKPSEHDVIVKAKSMFSLSHVAPFSQEDKKVDETNNKTEESSPERIVKTEADKTVSNNHEVPIFTFQRVANDVRRSLGVARRLLENKRLARTTKTNITFDEFVDKQKGLQAPVTQSEYPSYKIDKRLVFLGKELDYPRLVIPFKSTFRKLWNSFILIIITYGLLWYPYEATYLFEETVPRSMVVLEAVLLAMCILDIFINMKTTYADENNEEIIDQKMLRKSYMSSLLFRVDILTTLPISELLLLILMDSDDLYKYYSLFKAVRFLRIFKIKKYSQFISFNPILKVFTTFGVFFLLTHWLSCIWYIVIRAQYVDTTDPSLVWIPITLRTIQDNPTSLFSFYDTMSTFDMYSYTMISVCMLMLGSDMFPATPFQVYLTMAIGVMGAVTMGYIFGSITFVISKLQAEDSFFGEKLEDLRNKLAINNVPKKLRVKVLEYFYYSWRKHRVLSKTNDFSELSIPLQRDLAFFQYQETIMKVPLFKELEPIEILSIIQKLKTCVYMPGDKIIREGERGNEMFFIQEGKVEVVIKKQETQPDGQVTASYQTINLEKGSYFGEIALISNSKRTSDVNAYEFCILDTFSKADYNNLKIEFPDIGPRLIAGLKHYKNNNMEKLVQILKNIQYFEGFPDDDLWVLVEKYMDLIFVDPDKVVIKPKEKTNSIYIILIGSVSCYPSNPQTRAYIKNLKNSDHMIKPSGVEDEENDDVICVDDNILDMEKDQFSINDQKKKLDLIKRYSYGECLGILDFDANETRCKEFYITDSGCQLGIINQALLTKMIEEDEDLYDRLRFNFIKSCPRKAVANVANIDETSVTATGRNTLSFRARDRVQNTDSRRGGTSHGKDKLLSTKETREEGEDSPVMKRLCKLEEQLGKLTEIVLQEQSKKNEERSRKVGHEGKSGVVSRFLLKGQGAREDVDSESKGEMMLELEKRIANALIDFKNVYLGRLDT